MDLEVKQALGGLHNAFAEFRTANDERVRQMLTKGSVDALLDEKIGRIDGEITRLQADVAKAKRAPHGYDGRGDLTKDQLEHAKAFSTWARKGREDGLREIEAKAMSVGSDPDGGYLVPADTSGRMVKKVYETSPIRQYASVQMVSGDRLTGRYDLDEASSGWVGETESRSETNTPDVGEWKIDLHEQYAEPRITQKLLDDAMVNVEAWLAEKVADRFARQENYAFINGDGIKKPRGLFTYTTAATADSSRTWGQMEHVKSGANGAFAGTNPANVLFDLMGALKAAYRQGAVWVTSRAVVTAMRKFTDTTGQYLWQPSFQMGQPQTFAGFAIAEMEDVPTLATNSLSLGFGNVREAYQIADGPGIRVLRDPYTAKPYVKFYTTKRTGGGVVNFEAFKFLKFAA